MMSRTLCHCSEPESSRSDPNPQPEAKLSRRSAYRGEDQTLGSGIPYLDPLQRPHHSLHLGGVAPLKAENRTFWDVMEAPPCGGQWGPAGADLHRDVLVLAAGLRGEHVGDFGVGRGLPADGTFDGSAPRAHAVLLHDDGDALVAEAVAAGQHRPLQGGEGQGGGGAAELGGGWRKTHLLAQRPGTDGTWFWVQPARRLVLGLEEEGFGVQFRHRCHGSPCSGVTFSRLVRYRNCPSFFCS